MSKTKGYRSANGSGTIRKKVVEKNGKTYEYWEARYTEGIDAGTGKQKQRSITGKTQKEVSQKLRSAMHKIDSGIYVQPSKRTVEQWLEYWLEVYVKPPATKLLTYDTYSSRVYTHIIPALGKIQLISLTSDQIQEFLNDMTRKKHLSPVTVKNTHGILHKALAQAVDSKIINFNPADYVKPPKVEKKEARYLTEEETISFISEIDKGEPLDKLFLVDLFTGMREGEICGLPRDSIDFKTGIVTIKQQLIRGKAKGSKYHLAPLKNSKIRRSRVAQSVLDILRERLEEQERDKEIAGDAWNNEWNLVFTDKLGNFIPPFRAYRHFRKISERLGISGSCFHSMRHTFAVMSFQEGDDPKTVQQNLGHATAAFTLDMYGHVSEKMSRSSADHMENFIEKVTDSKEKS